MCLHLLHKPRVAYIVFTVLCCRINRYFYRTFFQKHLVTEKKFLRSNILCTLQMLMIMMMTMRMYNDEEDDDEVDDYYCYYYSWICVAGLKDLEPWELRCGRASPEVTHCLDYWAWRAGSSHDVRSAYSVDSAVLAVRGSRRDIRLYLLHAYQSASYTRPEVPGAAGSGGGGRGNDHHRHTPVPL